MPGFVLGPKSLGRGCSLVSAQQRSTLNSITVGYLRGSVAVWMSWILAVIPGIF